MSQEIRIGLIGTGGMMHCHVQHLERLPEVRIVTLADPDAGNRRAYRERYASLREASEYDDYRPMLDREKLTGMVIASPHTVHFEQIMAALDRGLHVLVEKPMVCRTDHAAQVVRKVRESGLVLVIGYQRHYIGTYRYVRRAVASEQVGKVQVVFGFLCQAWRRVTAGTWRQVPELSGGGELNDSGSHLVDILLWMTGLEAESVSAQIDNCGTPVDVNSAIGARFTNGAVGTLTIIGDHPTEPMWEDISITGDRGGFHIRHGRPMVQLLGRGDAVLTVDAEWMAGGGSVPQNFVRCIQGAEKPAAPAECGLRVIQLTEAAWKSAEKGGQLVKVQRTKL